jgi:hypothetical protein
MRWNCDVASDRALDRALVAALQYQDDEKITMHFFF